jgi:hypothetical protein
VALRRGSATLPGSGLCDSLIVFAVFARHEPSHEGGEPGGNVVRAARVTHGGSGCDGACDGVARNLKFEIVYNMYLVKPAAVSRPPRMCK